MPLPSRRVLLGGALCVSLAGFGLTAFAADPTAGCSFKDPAADTALPDSTGSPDQDLDLVTVGFSANDTQLLLSAKVTKLSAGPDLFPGDDFEFDFTVNKKAFTVGNVRDLMSSDGLYVTVGGTDMTASAPSLKATYDEKTSVVEVAMASADLSKLAGVPAAGAELSALAASTYAVVANGGPERKGDDAKPTGTVTWTYAAASCGGAAPAPTGSPTGGPAPGGSDTGTATIAVSAPARIRTSDPEPVTATLKDSSGKPVAGKRVTAQVGAGKAVAGTTNTSGQVRLAPVVIDKAGTRTLVVRYAGDTTGAGKAEKRQNVTVLAEISKLATKSSGTGSTRTFRITLTDDDAVRHPYAGAKLTVAYSGKSVVVTTNGSGQVTLAIRTGTHVDIRYAGRAGYVQTATARTVV